MKIVYIYPKFLNSKFLNLLNLKSNCTYLPQIDFIIISFNFFYFIFIIITLLLIFLLFYLIKQKIKRNSLRNFYKLKNLYCFLLLFLIELNKIKINFKFCIFNNFLKNNNCFCLKF